MAANTSQFIRGRVSSVLASEPFSFLRAQTPFDFAQQPSGQIDQTYTVEVEGGEIIGGFSYIEERIDRVRIGVARTFDGDPEAVYQQLIVDATSIVAAIVRDGAEDGGDYDVMDGGRGVSIEHAGNEEFAVLRLSVPVDYEAQL